MMDDGVGENKSDSAETDSKTLMDCIMQQLEGDESLQKSIEVLAGLAKERKSPSDEKKARIDRLKAWLTTDIGPVVKLFVSKGRSHISRCNEILRMAGDLQFLVPPLQAEEVAKKLCQWIPAFRSIKLMKNSLDRSLSVHTLGVAKMAYMLLLLRILQAGWEFLAQTIWPGDHKKWKLELDNTVYSWTLAFSELNTEENELGFDRAVMNNLAYLSDEAVRESNYPTGSDVGERTWHGLGDLIYGAATEGMMLPKAVTDFQNNFKTLIEDEFKTGFFLILNMGQ